MKLKTQILPLLILFVSIQQVIAQTNGPQQPEYKSFTPVSINDMVNEFNGNFNFNIPVLTVPGPNGSSYSMILNYTSGSSPNEQASWVGFGWNLNAGAITRQTSGFPDDFKGVEVKYWNLTRDNITIKDRFSARTELFSLDDNDEDVDMNVNASYSKILNNYCGYTNMYGVGGGYADYFTLSGNWDSKGNWGLDFQPNFYRILADLTGWSLFPEKEKKLDFFEKSFRAELVKIGSAAVNRGFFGNIITNVNLSESLSGRFFSMPGSVPYYSGKETSYSFAGNYQDAYLKAESDIIDHSVRTQKTKNYTVKAYGHLYNGDATGRDSRMDYTVERDKGYDMKTRFLGIPYSNADRFMVSGMGLQGAFRIEHNDIGCYKPFYTNNITRLRKYGFAGGYDNTLDIVNVGVDYSHGTQYLVFDWRVNDNDFYPEEEKRYTIKFENDLGSGRIYESAISSSSGNLLDDEKIITAGTDGNLQAVNTEIDDMNGKGSVLVNFNTFRDLKKERAESPVIYSKRHRAVSDPAIYGMDENLIAEFSIVDANGTRRNYGLPVFSRNERNISYGVNMENIENYSSGSISFETDKYGKSIVFMDMYNQEDRMVVTGTECNAPYVSSYLLTEIFTPDYVDLTNNGPTPDDHGGYTIFNYRRAAGTDMKSDPYADQWQNQDGYENTETGFSPGDSNDCWYKWRNPYRGYLFQRNSLSDYNDDMCSFSSGERELYYLESIETKTHIAYFVTNKTNLTITILDDDGEITTKQITGTLLDDEVAERKDGYEADHNENNAGKTDDYTLPEVNKSEFLERIELYSKASETINGGSSLIHAELLTTTKFQYYIDYPIWKDQPNSIANSETGKNFGKLSLRRLWFDQRDIKDYGVSTYEFDYVYDSGENYPEIYENLRDYGAEKEQEPDYDQFKIDRWGNHRKEGFSWNDNYKTWLNQNPDSDFDPAAWSLKNINLPSQGEIHIHYEPNEYSFVQDRNVSVMCKIDSYDGNMQVVVDLNQLPGYSDIIDKSIVNSDILELFNRIFFKENELIYFKFLYTVLGDRVGIDYCTSEFINGWSHVNFTLGNDPYIDPATNKLYFHFARENNENIPLFSCREFYKNNRAGIMDENEYNCEPCSSYERSYLDYEELSDFWNMFSAIEGDDELCKHIDFDNSYIRLPLPESLPKKGGGIRVKRVLMFDPFMSRINEDAEAELYGTEYIYKTQDNNCSGVATNEPGIGRYENSLIRNIKDDVVDASISYMDGLFSFSNKPAELILEEGPIGESLLPAPSVAYSRIVAKSIYDGSDNGGIVEKEFWTCRDYPLLNSKSVKLTNIDKDFDFLTPWVWPVTRIVKKYYASQGFKFILNNMHGKPRRTASYMAVPVATDDGYDVNSDNWSLTSFTEWKYYPYDDPVPVYNWETKSLENEFLGTDMEIVFESKKMMDDLYLVKGEADFDVQLPFTPWSISANAGYDRICTKTHIHSTNTIINCPVFTKSIKSYMDGRYSLTENLAFDPNSGRALITRSNDGFDELSLQKSANHDGSYHNIVIPISHEYEETGQKAEFENKEFFSNDNMHMYRRISGQGYFIYLYFPSEDHEPDYFGSDAWVLQNNETLFLSEIIPGDIIEVAPECTLDGEKVFISLNDPEYYQIIDIQGNVVCLEPLYEPESEAPSDMKCCFRIVKSGRTNELSSDFAYLTTYGNSASLPIESNLTKEALPIISDSELQNRQLLVDALNACIKTIGYWDGSIIYTGGPLKIAKPCGGFMEINAGDISDKIYLEVINDYWNSILNFRIGVNEVLESDVQILDFSQEKNRLVSDLNNFLDRIFSVDLNKEIPDFLADNNLGGFHHTDICTNDDIRCVQIFINDEQKKLIDKITGFERIRSSVYSINGIWISGDDLFERGDEISILYDRCNDKCILGKYQFAFKPEYSDYWKGFNTDPLLNRWFGINRFKNASGPQIEICLATNFGYPTITGMYDQANTINFTDQYVYFSANPNGSLKYTSRLVNSVNDFVAGKLPMMIFDIGDLDTVNCTMDLRWTPGYNVPEDHEWLMLNEKGQLCVNPDNSQCYSEDRFLPHTWSRDISCIEFIDDYEPNYNIDNIIVAGATRLSDDWETIEGFSIDNSNPDNPYQRGEKGRWRTKETIVPNYSIVPGSDFNDPDSRIYTNAGVIEDFLMPHRYRNGIPQPGWIISSQSNSFTPDGIPVQMVSNPDLISSINVGNQIWDNTASEFKPTDISYISAAAANAGYKNVSYQGFENFGVSANISEEYAHTGKFSYKLTDNEYMLPAGEINISEAMKYDQQNVDRGLLVQLWAHRVMSESEINNYSNSVAGFPDVIDCDLQCRFDFSDDQANTNSFEINMNHIVKTGQWALYEAILQEEDFSPVGGNDIRIKVNIKSTYDGIAEENYIWLDDVRILPLSAEMSCYVYDNIDNSMMAMLDNNHFATYFQYNQKGQFIRTMKETARGVMTVSETITNTPFQDRLYNPNLIFPVGKIPAPDSDFEFDYNNFMIPGNIQEQHKTDGPGIDADLDIFELKFDPENQKIKVFGMDKDSINVKKILPKPNLPDSLNLPDADINRPDIKSPIKGIEEKLETCKKPIPEIKLPDLPKEEINDIIEDKKKKVDSLSKINKNTNPNQIKEK